MLFKKFYFYSNVIKRKHLLFVLIWNTVLVCTMHCSQRKLLCYCNRFGKIILSSKLSSLCLHSFLAVELTIILILIVVIIIVIIISSVIIFIMIVENIISPGGLGFPVRTAYLPYRLYVWSDLSLTTRVIRCLWMEKLPWLMLLSPPAEGRWYWGLNYVLNLCVCRKAEFTRTTVYLSIRLLNSFCCGWHLLQVHFWSLLPTSFWIQSWDVHENLRQSILVYAHYVSVEFQF